MKKLLILSIIGLLLMASCKKDSEADAPTSPYKFKYEAPFKAYIYVAYYSGGQYTAVYYNAANSSTSLNADPGTEISFDPTLIKDSVILHFSNPANPKSGSITASIIKESEIKLTKSITDTALYLKYSF